MTNDTEVILMLKSIFSLDSFNTPKNIGFS